MTLQVYNTSQVNTATFYILFNFISQQQQQQQQQQQNHKTISLTVPFCSVFVV